MLPLNHAAAISTEITVLTRETIWPILQPTNSPLLFAPFGNPGWVHPRPARAVLFPVLRRTPARRLRTHLASPARTASTLAEVRDRTFILRRMLPTCLFAVSELIPSVAPISLSEAPAASNCSTVSSRNVRP